MKPVHKLGCIVFFSVFSLLVQAGCSSSPPSRFYTLTPLAVTDTPIKAEQKDAPVLAVGPVRIPDYLDRPQIVTRSGQNELVLAELHRWGGSLDNDLKRILVENITVLLSPNGYSVVHWPSAGRGDVSADHRVVLDILRFEGVPGDSVSLKCQWEILGKNEGGHLIVRTSTYTEPLKGSDYDSLTAAMSRALAALSREIADAVRGLAPKAGK